MNNALILWIALAVIFAVAEAATVQIVTVWFCVGSIGAIVANLLGAGAPVQLLVFVAISLLTLIAARPYLKKFTKTQVQPTNADMCIGKEALVLETINNTEATGQVKVGGIVWSARSKDGNVIEKDALVTVDSISGVKLIVTAK